MIKALWTQPSVTSYPGRFYNFDDGDDGAEAAAAAASAALDGGRPSECLPSGGIACGWLDGIGGSSIAEFARSVPLLNDALAEAGRDPTGFPISKRILSPSMNGRKSPGRSSIAGSPSVSQSGRNRRLRHSWHPGTGPRKIGSRGHRDGREPSAVEPRVTLRGAGGSVGRSGGTEVIPVRAFSL